MADVQSGNATPMSGLGALGGLPMLPMLPGMSGLPAFKKPGPPMIPRLPPPPEPALDSGDLALSLEPDAFRHIETAMEEHVKNEMNIRLDTDAQICMRNLQPGGCPLGASCLQRHTQPAPRNFRAPSPPPANPHARMVCKHWLRGLCKKGTACDFMHEYNLKKMPECWFYSEYGWCQAGDECMYLHNTAVDRRPECKDYVRGFCAQGNACPYKHIRRVACPLFLDGFCPRGWNCSLTHPPYQPADVERAVAATSKKPGEEQVAEVANSGRQTGTGRPMRDVTCFKCGQKGHLANICPNPSVPGLRGGVERGAGGRVVRGDGAPPPGRF